MVDPFAIGGALEIIYGLIAVTFAGVVYHAAPQNLVNRSLAILLLVDGATSGGLVVGISRFVEHEGASRALQATQFLGNGSRPLLYLAFIAAAMPLAWTRPFEHRVGRIVLYAGAASAGLAAALLGIDNPWIKDTFQATFLLIGLLGFTSAVIVFRRSEGDARRKNRAYLQAFSVRDIGALILLPIRDLAVEGSLLQGWTLVAVKLVYVAFILLVVYGVLVGQIVDLDAAARATFTQAAAVTVIAGMFIAITDSLNAWLPWDSLPFDASLLALATSILLAFMFEPIQERAEGLALRLFPGIGASAREYALAVEVAAEENTLTPSEQKVLRGVWERHRGVTFKSEGP